VLRLNATTADFSAMTFINIKTEVKLETAEWNHEWNFNMYTILCGSDDGV
jgi:hypothetical protein